MKHPRLIPTGFIIASGSLALVACSTAPQPNVALDQARAAYTAASNDATVRHAAPHELEDAHEFLTKADNTAQAVRPVWDHDATTAEINHYAYMAQRYSEVAQERSKVRMGVLQGNASARVITLGNMLFATGKADLNPNGRQAVAELATHMQHYPGETVTIIGHTDSTGSAKLNAALSEQRANAVREALVEAGINPSRLEARGVGPAEPVASNRTAAGRRENRRVEIAIAHEGAAGGSTAGEGSSAPTGSSGSEAAPPQN